MKLYSSPLAKGYWHDAVSDFKKLRVLVFSALMVAACVAMSYIPSIHVAENVKVTWGFLARATCALVGGPINALVFGFVEDTVGFFMNPDGGYFFGYALTTMLGTMIYALFFYRARVTVLRIVLAKICTNVLNVFLGSLWSAMLYSKGYIYYMTKSAMKNLVMLPVQIIMLVVLFGALLPVLHKMGFLPNQAERLGLFRQKAKD
ncbi:MAG: folate family ECF transporter S component [Oscillospiraceae bacterium]|nr:folate family ECF transporter S component [Oscillospiraceae bacterium]